MLSHPYHPFLLPKTAHSALRDGFFSEYAVILRLDIVQDCSLVEVVFKILCAKKSELSKKSQNLHWDCSLNRLCLSGGTNTQKTWVFSLNCLLINSNLNLTTRFVFNFVKTWACFNCNRNIILVSLHVVLWIWILSHEDDNDKSSHIGHVCTSCLL